MESIVASPHASLRSVLASLIGLSALIASVLILLYRRRRSHENRGLTEAGGARARSPPGPPALPVIGHLHLLGSNPHRSFYHLCKSYGPLISLRLGAVPVVVASTPDMAMQILQTHDRVLCGRPPQLSLPKNCLGSPDVVFSSPSPYWRLMRQVCVTDLFSNTRLEYFKPIRTEELGVLMRSILAAAGTPIPILRKLQDTNNNIISRMLLGRRVQDLAAPSSDLQKESGSVVSILVEMIKVVGGFNVGDFIPSLSWLDIQGYVKQSKDLGRRANAILQEVIDTRRKSHKEGDPPKDYLDLLLSAALESKHKDLQLEDGHIRAILIDLLGAGTDTAAVIIEWALAELLAHPQKLRKIQEELDEVVGQSQILKESDLPNLPYLQAVISETMRLHPAAPLLAPHYALESCEIAGYTIPVNTMIYVNTWAIGRDPRTWESPHEFCPERFLMGMPNNNIDPLGQHFELTPFGSGRRICVGRKLGLLSVGLILGGLLHAFDWSTITPLDMNEKFGIVMTRKTPLIAMPTPRLARSLFQEYM